MVSLVVYKTKNVPNFMCKQNQQLSSSHLDIDECAEGTDGCNQTCTNTLGSRDCSCYSGYRLNRDNHGCDGMCNHQVKTNDGS